MFLNDVAAMHFGGPLIFTAKFVLAWPVMYHLWNGFRYLTNVQLNQASQIIYHIAFVLSFIISTGQYYFLQ